MVEPPNTLLIGVSMACSVILPKTIKKKKEKKKDSNSHHQKSQNVVRVVKNSPDLLIGPDLTHITDPQ